MVRVPRYTDKEVLRPRGRQNVNLSINANQFGAQVGQAVEQAGGAIFDVAEAVDAKQMVEAENTAREAELEFRDRQRRILYDPEEGYLNQDGGNALGGARDSTIERLRQERADIAGSISNPRARRAFEKQTDKLIVSAQDTTIKHEGVEFKDFTLNTIEAVAQASLQDALTNFNDDTKFRAGIDEAARQIVKAGDLNGDSNEVTQGKLDQLLSTAEAGRVVEMAREDPIAAWDYLERHSDTIERDQYNKLRDGLEPAYYGAQAREWVSKENVAAGASVDEYGNSVTAEGIPYFIIGPESAGDWNAQNSESTAGGPVQFIESTWMGLVEQIQPGWAQGKSREEVLSYRYGKENRDKIGQVYREFRKQNQQALQRYGFAITPRNEYMAHHLGTEGARLVLRAEEMGTTSSSFLGLVRASLGERTAKQWADQNPWMQGKTVAGAIKFFENKTAKHSGGGVTNPVMAMQDAIEIKDPKLRAAVMSELELRQSVAQAGRQESQRVSEEQAWDIIDQGGTVDDIPPELQVEVGAVVMNTIRNTQERTMLGVDVTDETRHLELIDMARDNPQEFAQLNLNDDRENLSRADLLALKETQTSLSDTFKQVDENGWSSVIYTDKDFKSAVSEAETQYQAATGINPTGAKTTQEQLQQFNRFRQQVWNGMRQFANTNGRAMTFEERTSYVNTLLLPTVIDGVDLKSGFGKGTYLFDAPTYARDGARAEPQLGRYDVPASEETRIREQFNSQFGRAPSEDEVVEQYETELLLSVGVDPNLEYSEVPKDIARKLKEADPSLDPAGITEVYMAMMLEMAAENALR